VPSSQECCNRSKHAARAKVACLGETKRPDQQWTEMKNRVDDGVRRILVPKKWRSLRAGEASFTGKWELGAAFTLVVFVLVDLLGQLVLLLVKRLPILFCQLAAVHLSHIALFPI